jgi:PIN domain nuclease of toxin-antitoxin system
VNYLLDTHVLLWLQGAPDKLGDHTSETIFEEANQIFVSTMSSLEIARLVWGDRVTFTMPISDWIEQACEFSDAQTIVLSHEIAVESYHLPEPFHRDPVDRALVATARCHGLTLLTADRRILSYSHVNSQNAAE